MAASTVVEEDPSTALSAAYYAMLYAARAALSERDISTKTHRGLWHELRRVFVETGELDVDLVASVQKIQPERRLRRLGGAGRGRTPRDRAGGCLHRRRRGAVCVRGRELSERAGGRLAR